MAELTAKQQAILDYIKNYIEANGYPPKIREIGDNFGRSVKCAYDHLLALERKGAITRENGERMISLTGYRVRLEKVQEVMP